LNVAVLYSGLVSRWAIITSDASSSLIDVSFLQEVKKLTKAIKMSKNDLAITLI
jgi:hypothetical protein